MNNDKLKYVLIGLAIGAIGVWAVTSTSLVPKTSNMMNPTSNSNSSQVLDSHFIEQMIPHHEDAITMAKAAQTKAQHPEIKQLADNIIDSQSKEITQMQEWYTSWFGKERPSGEQVMNQHGMMGNSSEMHMGMLGDDTDMKTLEDASQFDKTFEEMIPHHQMAVMMANMLLQGTNRPEMKELANNIISAQTEEIKEMRQWYKDWGYTE